jgi:two-component system, LytTR family, sensor kinase
MTDRKTRVRTARWAWIAAIWIAGGLFEAIQSVLFMRAIGRRHAWLIFGTEMASWLPWALVTPLLISLARRYEIIRGTTFRTAAVHLAAFASISLVAEVWFVALQVLFNPWDYPQQPAFIDTLRTSLLFQVFTYLLVYVLILIVTYVIDARESMARQITEKARLSDELSKSKLAALRQQIEPHFMFNTLNSITGLVRDSKNDAAVSMIVGLSEFLRRGLDESHRLQVTLAEEVEYLQRYVEIQKVRFGERLQVSMDIPAELLCAQVPNLMLQPLVENAIKHGIAKRANGGVVRIAGARENDNLCLRVYNDGPDSPTDWSAARTGVGIGNLRTRLEILHGKGCALQLTRTDTGAAEVVVTLPLREA